MKCLIRIRDALLSVHDNVGHHFSLKQEYPYIVWAEDSSRVFGADDTIAEQTMQGTIDLYTKTEFDPLVEGIQQALSAAKIPWRLNTIMADEDTGALHYEWVWEVAYAV